MKEKLLEKLVSKYVDELVKESNNIFDTLYDEGVQFININLKNYLSKYQKKYSTIKTLLFGNTPMPLYDIYYHINLKIKSKVIDTKDVKNIFEIDDKITIIGDAGGGKSTLVKHLFLNCITSKVGIPILIELRYFNNNECSFEEYLSQEVFSTELVVNKEVLDRYLDKGKFIFFLDGYDELNSEITQKVIKELKTFYKKYSENRFVLTTRPYSNIEFLDEFTNLKLCDLNSKDVDDFISLQLKEEKELADKIIKSINDNKDKKYINSFFKNPLLLSLYILTFQSNSSVPDKKYIFYRRVINALFSEHDSKTKLGFRREKKSKLTQEQFEEILKRFCFLTYFSSKFNFDIDYINKLLIDIKTKLQGLTFDRNKLIEDLLLSIAIWVEDGGIYSFAHRSIQEYYCSLFISGLNEVNKQKIYKKIIGNLNKRRFREMENLMSLCREMDEINFTKFLHIPILKRIQKHFNVSDEKGLEKYITFLFQDFSIQENTLKEVKVVRHEANLFAVSASDILQEKEINENGNFILRYFGRDDTQLFIKHLIKIGFPINDGMKKKKLKVDIDDRVLEFFDTPEINKKASQFKDYISNKINNLEEYVANSESSDEELLSMI